MTAPSPKRVSRARSGLLAAAAFAALTIAAGSAATEIIVEAAPTSESAGTEIERFCSNIADAARDRRYALQAQELQQLRQGVDERVKLLEEKRAEYESWLKRREDFLSQAEDKLVGIYGAMRPDAAAERLAEIDVELAASILMKLDTRKASVILNEMDSKAAALLTGVIASAARRTDPA